MGWGSLSIESDDRPDPNLRWEAVGSRFWSGAVENRARLGDARSPSMVAESDGCVFMYEAAISTYECTSDNIGGAHIMCSMVKLRFRMVHAGLIALCHNIIGLDTIFHW